MAALRGDTLLFALHITIFTQILINCCQHEAPKSDINNINHLSETMIKHEVVNCNSPIIKIIIM